MYTCTNEIDLLSTNDIPTWGQYILWLLLFQSYSWQELNILCTEMNDGHLQHKPMLDNIETTTSQHVYEYNMSAGHELTPMPTLEQNCAILQNYGIMGDYLGAFYRLLMN